MLQRIKELKPAYPVIMILSLLLIYIANISVSSSSFALWHEPDCPKELQ